MHGHTCNVSPETCRITRCCGVAQPADEICHPCLPASGEECAAKRLTIERINEDEVRTCKHSCDPKRSEEYALELQREVDSMLVER